MVSAVASSRVVNTFIACWVIILEVARIGMACTVEHGEVRRGGGIVAGRTINGTAPGVLFQVTRLCNCGFCFIALFCRGIACVHDRWCVGDPWRGKNGCRIDHPLLCLFVNCLAHPLFLQEFGRMQNLLNVGLEELDELATASRPVSNGSRVRQFLNECLKMLIWGEIRELAMLRK